MMVALFFTPIKKEIPAHSIMSFTFSGHRSLATKTVKQSLYKISISLAR